MKDIIKKYGTPVYVFDVSELKRRVAYLRSVLPENARLCYALKANPFIARQCFDSVDYLEVCSEGEARIVAESCGGNGKSVISGVNKNREFTERLITHDMPDSFTAESYLQHAMLRELARKHKTRLRVVLRLTSANQFGMSEEDIFKILAEEPDEYIDIIGIQYFSTTQKTSVKRVGRELAAIGDFLQRARERFGFKAQRLEYGTGLPVSYFDGESLDETEVISALCDGLKALAFEGEIVLETGRSVAASCGKYITEIVDVKENKAGRFAIADGGIHQVAFYGQSMAMKKPKYSVLPERGKSGKITTVCGSLCTINDILLKGVEEELEIGDALIFENAGAYCMTEGVSLLLSRELPAVVLREKSGETVLLREREPTYTLNTRRRAQ